MSKKYFQGSKLGHGTENARKITHKLITLMFNKINSQKILKLINIKIGSSTRKHAS